MEHLSELWSPLAIILAAFVMGWAAETAQTFIPRALALSLLAWLQTLPEFAVEAAIAWKQERDLMIANLTGSLRLLVGLGFPLVFFTHFVFHYLRERKWAWKIEMDDEDSLGMVFLFISIAYFFIVWAKNTLSLWDVIPLVIIYVGYLLLSLRLPVGAEDHDDLPWIGRHIVKLPGKGPHFGVTALFLVSGLVLYLAVDPFLHTLERYAVKLGISTFVFIQWVAPFLSEFPEKLSAFNWARQRGKAGLAMMNFVNSNINQWTMLSAMIPIVFNLSLGHYEAIHFTTLHRQELALTIAQSLTAGTIMLNLEIGFFEIVLLFGLWVTQFLIPHAREPITWIHVAWSSLELLRLFVMGIVRRELPRSLVALPKVMRIRA